jgi:phosphoadenosine phosphosulfate reductase
MQVYFPESADVESFVQEKGINAFYESVENRKECCFLRKVKPLNRALAGAKVWITGLRAEQSDNRQDMPLIEWDEQRQLYKFNPLINWTYGEVLDYLNVNNVPYNSLHDKGFISIGCAPCTRAIGHGEDARAGRWWWESSQKEAAVAPTALGPLLYPHELLTMIAGTCFLLVYFLNRAISRH